MDLRLLRALLVALLCLTGAGVGSQTAAEPVPRAQIELRQGRAEPGHLDEDEGPGAVQAEHLHTCAPSRPRGGRVLRAPEAAPALAVPRFLRHRALLI